MKFSFWPRPTHPYDRLLALAHHVEQTGWHGLWLADHFMPNAEDTSVPWPEAFTTLSALAAAVPRLRLGTLVAGNTYRHPAVLTKMATTIDHISGGRMVLGIGAGWQENEHRKYGIPFFSVAERLEKLEEACQVVKALTRANSASFSGKHYTLDCAPLEPKPIQSPLPLLVGGGGEKVTLRITAQYADEWNVWGTLETAKRKIEILDQHCLRLQRDPATLRRTIVALVFLTDDHKFALKMRQNTQATVAGSVSELQEIFGAYAELGVDEFIVPDFNLGSRPEEVLSQLSEDVFPALSSYREPSN